MEIKHRGRVGKLGHPFDQRLGGQHPRIAKPPLAFGVPASRHRLANQINDHIDAIKCCVGGQANDAVPFNDPGTRQDLGGLFRIARQDDSFVSQAPQCGPQMAPQESRRSGDQESHASLFLSLASIANSIVPRDCSMLAGCGVALERITSV